MQSITAATAAMAGTASAVRSVGAAFAAGHGQGTAGGPHSGG